MENQENIKIEFFGDEACGVCRKVIEAMQEKGLSWETTVVPLKGVGYPANRSYRFKVVYQGDLFPQLKGKTYGELFQENPGIPKMVVQEPGQEPKKLYDSSDMLNLFERLA